MPCGFPKQTWCCLFLFSPSPLLLLSFPPHLKHPLVCTFQLPQHPCPSLPPTMVLSLLSWFLWFLQVIDPHLKIWSWEPQIWQNMQSLSSWVWVTSLSAYVNRQNLTRPQMRMYRQIMPPERGRSTLPQGWVPLLLVQHPKWPSLKAKHINNTKWTQ